MRPLSYFINAVAHAVSKASPPDRKPTACYLGFWLFLPVFCFSLVYNYWGLPSSVPMTTKLIITSAGFQRRLAHSECAIFYTRF